MPPWYTVLLQPQSKEATWPCASLGNYKPKGTLFPEKLIISISTPLVRFEGLLQLFPSSSPSPPPLPPLTLFLLFHPYLFAPGNLGAGKVEFQLRGKFALIPAPRCCPQVSMVMFEQCPTSQGAWLHRQLSNPTPPPPTISGTLKWKLHTQAFWLLWGRPFVSCKNAILLDGFGIFQKSSTWKAESRFLNIFKLCF